MKKNKRVIIVLSLLILGIGVSLAYFVGKTIFKGTGATTEGRTATVNGSILDISGNIEFKDIDIYPGHQTLSKVIATATGNNELIAYNLTWVGTNDLNTNLKYKVYVSEEEKEITLNCEKKKKVINGAQQLNEVCTITGELGEPISEGEIPKLTEEEQTIKITNTEFITSKETGEKKYYYIIVEYPDNGNQSIDIGEGFEGKVYGEISNTKADINILGYFIKNEETGKYEEAKEMPGEGYEINTEASQCTNGVTAISDLTDNTVKIKGLTINGTTCYLYYDKIKLSDKTLAALKLDSQGDAGTITGPSCTGSQGSTCYSADSDGKTNNMAQHGVFSAEDDFGTSYYFRGFVQNNWVKFGKEGSDDIWWRIIRINGNGTIRLIYAGKGSTAPDTTGPGTQISTTYSDNINQQYNATRSDNRYVGFMYGNSTTNYQLTHENKNKSTIMGELETWYGKTNLGTLEAKIDVDTGFCNDRQVDTTSVSGYAGDGSGTKQTAYAPWTRLYNESWKSEQTPTLKCTNATNDLFTGPNATNGGTEGKDGKKIEGNGKLTKPVGLITSDEVVYAGGFGGQTNNGYWLYTGQNYWTMSPYNTGSRGTAGVFVVGASGSINNASVHGAYGVRPVINLKKDVELTFISEENKGTYSNPYIVQ